ncbi:MAG: nuclear transport factor 2 family protein [Hyphomicrobiales bacterium]|nr:nuclear transport factor 2 family protein [Hyphomicrobiales bacterium]
MGLVQFCRILVWVGSAVLVGTVSSLAEDAAFTPRDIETVYKEAMAKRDASIVASYYTDDAQLFAPNGRVFKGRAAIEEDMAEGYRVSARELTASDITVDGDDDQAVLIWNWTLEVTPDGGRTQTVHGRSLHVWVNGDDGWKITYDLYQTF